MDFPIELENGVTIHAVTDPVWGDRAHTFINCTIQVSGAVFQDNELVPFTATPWDEMSHGKDIFEALKDSASEWVRPDVTAYDLQVELDAIWPDVVLGLADQATMDLARDLRTQIKAMS